MKTLAVSSISRRRFVLAIMLVALCAAARVAGQSAADYIIGPQDILLIQLYDQPDLNGRYTVEADGSINFPLLGRIKAGGMSVRAFEADLKKRLTPDYFRNPQLTVSVETYRSQRVFIRGEVRAPGAIILTGGMTLIEALSRAGDVAPSASGEILIVRPPADGREGAEPEFLRASLPEIERGNLAQNVALRDGDQVIVSKAESIYVSGQVKTPGSYTIRQGTTVLQALTLAGGPTELAATNRIDILRMVEGEQKTIRVKTTDLVQPGDTIVVPQRYF